MMTYTHSFPISVVAVLCLLAGTAHGQINAYQWTKVTQTGGPSVSEHATGYDFIRNQLIVFGGKYVCMVLCFVWCPYFVFVLFFFVFLPGHACILTP